MTEDLFEANGFHNPWRSPLENCMKGDNFLRAQEWIDLIEELDDLYRYRCGQHDALQVARKPLTEEQIDALAMGEDGLPNSHLEFARAIERAHGISA